MSDTFKTYYQYLSKVGNITNNFMLSASMPVISSPSNLFQDEKELYSFLAACQEKIVTKGDEQVVSFAHPLPLTDPLAILEAIVEPNQLHFYWENQNKEEAILAYGTARSLVINGADRFEQCQKFLRNCWKQILPTGQSRFNTANPYFFSSFTFFNSKTSPSSPFPGATVFLPRWQVIRQQNKCLLLANLVLSGETNLELLLTQLSREIKAIHNASQNSFNLPSDLCRFDPKCLDINASQFQQAVASALKSIAANQLSKIVLAHAVDLRSEKDFSLLQSLANLRQQHADCYIFSTSNGQGDYFLGASPERLISIQNRQLVTDALAGSAPRGKTTSEDANLAKKMLQSGKERREHNAVSEFILQRLTQLGLKPQKAHLQLLQLSNIQHLWTPIYAQLPRNASPLQIVAQLHPTPAVAGVPTELACQKIRSYEKFDRSLYAAPLGWIDYQGNAEFIVGIRSALIQKNQARIYAGAGIVAGSSPEREFAEVQLKLKFLLKSLV